MSNFTKAFAWGFGLWLGVCMAALLMAIPLFVLTVGMIAASTGA